MERRLFDQMAAEDGTHWWYTARRRVLESVIRRHAAPPPGGRVLEVGCGTGHSLPMLARWGRVDATEPDGPARAVAERRLGRPVSATTLPDMPGIERGAFHLVALLDVLEHLDDDHAALLTLRALLAPGGRLLVAVPAHPWMWSEHDVANHHRRRYTHAALAAVLAKAGLRVELLQPMNSLLFPLAVLGRGAAKLTRRKLTDEAQAPTLLNPVFDRVFGWEAYLVGRVPMPPGLSLVAVASAAT